MLYNTKMNKPKTNLDCLKCEYFDKTKKKCNGLGVCCEEYDPLTDTLIDSLTKLPKKSEDR